MQYLYQFLLCVCYILLFIILVQKRWTLLTILLEQIIIVLLFFSYMIVCSQKNLSKVHVSILLMVYLLYSRIESIQKSFYAALIEKLFLWLRLYQDSFDFWLKIFSVCLIKRLEYLLRYNWKSEGYLFRATLRNTEKFYYVPTDSKKETSLKLFG